MCMCTRCGPMVFKWITQTRTHTKNVPNERNCFLRIKIIQNERHNGFLSSSSLLCRWIFVYCVVYFSLIFYSRRVWDLSFRKIKTDFFFLSIFVNSFLIEKKLQREFRILSIWISLHRLCSFVFAGKKYATNLHVQTNTKTIYLWNETKANKYLAFSSSFIGLFATWFMYIHCTVHCIHFHITCSPIVYDSGIFILLQHVNRLSK